MYAKITKDHIDCTETLGPEFLREGKVIVGDKPDGPLVQCRVYDDDGELYFDLEATDDEALEEAFMWCQRDTGVTRMDVLVEGEWRITIA